ncbi:MAG: hypothetical protein GWP59_04595 [Chlamydiales bacterium]|nr:hypothetical protein [Chlamydiales bacterium]NCF70963.1 hypothetical protein [Chlamydiales bacterium]
MLKFEYTLKGIESEMLFLGFSDNLSELNTRTMIDIDISHLLQLIDLEQARSIFTE